MKVTEELILREIAGEYVLIPTGEMASKIYGIIGLNGTGVFLYKQLQRETTVEELVETLLREYETDRETAERDVKRFLKKMEEAGILS